LDRERRPPIGTARFGVNCAETLALSASPFTGFRDRGPDRNVLRYFRSFRRHFSHPLHNAHRRLAEVPLLVAAESRGTS
jgi:hypothetical protein